VQFTIEAQSLSSRSPSAHQFQRMRIEAANEDDAVHQFARDSACELMSVTRPLRGRESFATVRKDDSLILVRIYPE